MNTLDSSYIILFFVSGFFELQQKMPVVQYIS